MATKAIRPGTARALSIAAARLAKRSTDHLSSGRRFLIDNSVWARLSTSEPVTAALRSIIDLANPDDVLVCPPIALEVGFSARNAAAHAALMNQLTVFPQCDAHPTTEEAGLIQFRLWDGGLLRAAGAMDTLIAAYAIKNRATLIHYDRDFEHIAAVMPELQHRWIVPRGSVS